MSGENPQAVPEETPETVEGAEQPIEDILEASVQGFAETSNSSEQIEKLEKDLAEMKDKWMRSVADVQNIRRRADRDKSDALKYGVTNFAREMVSVADNMRRALENVPDDLKESDLIKGIDMTERELQSAFNKAGIKRIEAIGKPFDHNFHQAMYEVDDANQPAGLVAQVMQDGYVIHDRLLRPAMVGVTKGGPKLEATAPAESEKEEAAKPSDEASEAGTILDQET